MVERIVKGQTFTEIRWIPAKNLSVVWANAQRPLNERHAKSIADDFDPEKIGTLAVTKPNGQGIYHIIDGQHRKVAIEMRWGKDELVPCNVFDAVDPQRAAELFADLNTKRRPPTAVDLFRVYVTAGSKVHTAINEIVLRCGYKVGRAENGISCVGAMEYVYHSYGPVVLEAALRCIKAIWGTDDVVAGSAYIVRGIGIFLAEFRHCDHKRLVEAIAGKYTPARFLATAKASKENFGGNLPNNIRDVMLRTYNDSTRSKKDKLVPAKKSD